MNKHQQAVVNEAPTSCKGIMERAYSGNSRTAAIKAFCLRCVGYIREDVRNCTALKCPLHQYRPYQDGEEAETAGEIAVESSQDSTEATV